MDKRLSGGEVLSDQDKQGHRGSKNDGGHAPRITTEPQSVHHLHVSHGQKGRRAGRRAPSDKEEHEEPHQEILHEPTAHRRLQLSGARQCPGHGQGIRPGSGRVQTQMGPPKKLAQRITPRGHLRPEKTPEIPRRESERRVSTGKKAEQTATKGKKENCGLATIRDINVWGRVTLHTKQEGGAICSRMEPVCHQGMEGKQQGTVSGHCGNSGTRRSNEEEGD